jgi:hypothetical protein
MTMLVDTDSAEPDDEPSAVAPDAGQPTSPSSPTSAPPSAPTPSDPPAPGYAPVTYWMKVAAGVIVVIALALMLVVLRHVLVLVLASLVLAVGLQPAVRWLTARNVRRGTAVAIIFAVGLLLVGAFLALVIPIVARQLTELIQSAPQYLERAQAQSSLLGKLDRQFHVIDKVKHAGTQIPAFALAFARGFASFVFDLVTVTILTAYFATALPSMQRSIARLLRREHREELELILERTTGRIGGYVTGNVIVSLIAGAATFVALVLLGVPRLLEVLRTFSKPRPEVPPHSYVGWPLWFVGAAFIHTRRAGGLLVLGLLLNALLPIRLPWIA